MMRNMRTKQDLVLFTLGSETPIFTGFIELKELLLWRIRQLGTMLFYT